MSAERDIGRNICAENGCNGACCKNQFFVPIQPHDFIKIAGRSDQRILVPEGELQTAADDIRKGHSPITQAVVYEELRNGDYAMYIAGNCPNLAADGSCTIYEVRPDICANLGFGSVECTISRRREGFPPVPGAALPPEKQTLLNQAGQVVKNIIISLKTGKK